MASASRGSRRGDVDAFIVMDVVERARLAEAAGRHIIHMEVGQPGTAAPAGALAAVRGALEQPLGYTVSLGLPELRAGIAGLYRHWYGVDLDPGRGDRDHRVIGRVHPGLYRAFRCGRPGGFGRARLSQLSPDPARLVVAAGGHSGAGQARLQPTPEDLEGWHVAGLIVASPGNPTGTILSHEVLARLVDWAAARGVAFISA